MIAKWWRREEGASGPFLIILMPALIGFIGLVYDGGMVFVAKREALNVASASARKGAADVTNSSLYGCTPDLNVSAPATAVQFAQKSGYKATASKPRGDQIEAVVEKDVDMIFLNVVGVQSVTVRESAISRVETFED